MAGQQFEFGSGVLYGRSAQSTTPTPVRFGVLQEVSLEFAFTTKPLYGQNQFPVAVGRGTAKVTGKAKYGQFNAQAFNDLFFGYSSLPTGETKTAVSEAATVTANVVNAAHNAAAFVADLGVVYAANGTIFTRVAAGANVGQYVCNESNGQYTFNSTDNNVAVLLNYTWNDTSNGKQITITNPLLGNAPTFKAVFTQTYNGQQQTMTLNACMSEKLTVATKLEDWTIPEFDFQAFADASGTIGTWGLDN